MKLSIIIPVYNAQHSLGRLLESIDAQKTENITVGVFAIDDASTDRSLAILTQYQPNSFKLTVLSKATNEGRGSALNYGASHSDAEAFLFLDADCYFKNTSAITQFAKAYLSGNKVVFGKLEDDNLDFWGDYFNHSQNKKNKIDFLSFSSTNMLCDRELFNNVGGFDNAYTHYGFEDRDLISRLMKQTSQITYCHSAILMHDIDESIESYLNKHYQSGRYSSSVFKSEFPKEYAGMRYSQIDYSAITRSKQLALTVLSHSLPFLIVVSKIGINRRWIPLSIRIKLVQLASGLSYFKGTKDALSSHHSD